MLLTFVIATSLSDGKLVPDFTPRDAPPATRASAQQNDEYLRTGSILITPADGNICEHRLIDNETWRIQAHGTVRCEAAVTRHPDRGGEHTSTWRIEAIRDGFISKR